MQNTLYNVDDLRWALGRVTEPNALFIYLVAALLNDHLKTNPMRVMHTPGRQAEPRPYNIVRFGVVRETQSRTTDYGLPPLKLTVFVDEPNLAYPFHPIDQGKQGQPSGIMHLANMGYRPETKHDCILWPMSVSDEDWRVIVRLFMAQQEIWNIAFPEPDLSTRTFDPGQTVYWKRACDMDNFMAIPKYKVVSQMTVRPNGMSNEAVDTALQPMPVFYGPSSSLQLVHSRDLMTQEEFRQWMLNPVEPAQPPRHEVSPWFDEEIMAKLTPDLRR